MYRAFRTEDNTQTKYQLGTVPLLLVAANQAIHIDLPPTRDLSLIPSRLLLGRWPNASLKEYQSKVFISQSYLASEAHVPVVHRLAVRSAASARDYSCKCPHGRNCRRSKYPLAHCTAPGTRSRTRSDMMVVGLHVLSARPLVRT